MATATYTHGHHSSVLRSHQWRTAENSAAYLLPHLDPTQSLLDVGCGPGTITADLAEQVGEVTAIDTVESVLAEARVVAAARELANISFGVADVERLRFADGGFDVVHAHQVLQHVGAPVTALREMRRVCAPGGVVAARDADYSAMAWYPRIPALDDWLDLYRRIATDNGGQPDAGRRLLSWAREAGFGDVTASSSTWCYATAQERRWWSGMWADRIVDSAIAADAVSRGYATPSDLERLAHGWREWGAAEDGWFSVLHGEILCRD